MRKGELSTSLGGVQVLAPGLLRLLRAWFLSFKRVRKPLNEHEVYLRVERWEGSGLKV